MKRRLKIRDLTRPSHVHQGLAEPCMAEEGLVGMLLTTINMSGWNAEGSGYEQTRVQGRVETGGRSTRQRAGSRSCVRGSVLVQKRQIHCAGITPLLATQTASLFSPGPDLLVPVAS